MENIETQEASLSEIQTEFVESVDDYSNEKLFSKQTSDDDENSLRAGESLLMPIIRNRSASNSDAYQDINPDQVFEQQGPLGQRKLITSAHTPAANIIGRLRTNFRSFVNRRENVYTSHESSTSSYPLQFRNNRRSSTNNTDTFSAIPGNDAMMHMTSKAFADPYEVYDGSQDYASDLHPMDSSGASKAAISRSPSVGPPTPSTELNKRQLRLRSSSEVRGRR